MFLQYLKTALRNAARHKLFTFINIFGLALSLSFCLLVIMIIQDQNGFDRFHPRANDIYRVLTDAHRKNGGMEPYASSPFPLGEVLASESPAVENVVHLVRGLNCDVEQGSTRLRVEGMFADKSFFDVLGFSLAVGDPASALSRPNTLVLTSTTAAKLFGLTDPVGKTVRLLGIGEFSVTGVLNASPGKTHLEFDVLGSIASMSVLERAGSVSSTLGNWSNYYSNYSYVRLRTGHSPSELEPLLGSVQDRFYSKLSLESRDRSYSFELQPLSEITPGRLLSQSMGRGLPSLVLYMLSGLALLGMLAALFNYTNLTLARSLARAKEIGLRKVAGAARRQLIVQFVSESVLMVLSALVFAFFLLEGGLIPVFQSLQFAEGADITLAMTPALLGYFCAFAVGIGIVAGLLPAIVMSGFRPSLVLKDVSRVSVFSRLTLRKVLLVFQFTLSLVLLIVLTVMDRQVRHALSMQYGMDTKRTMTVRLQGQDPGRVEQLFAQDKDVASMTVMSNHPLTWEDWSWDVRSARTDDPVGVRGYSVDENFVPLFGLRLVAGDGFRKDAPALNRSQVLVNERFVEQFKLGGSADAVGHELILDDSTHVRIAGVLKDFYFKPATYALAPMILRYDSSQWNVLALRLRTGDTAPVFARLEKAWKSIDPYHPFFARTYETILAETYDMYSEMVTIVGFLALLAFAISMLGLLGIVTFQAESRIKEIGIRKVLGAGIRNVIVLLARNEMTLLLLSTVIAVPAALLIADGLLEEFSQRIQPGVFEVLPALLVVYGCAAATIAWQALRAARSNPVDALRYE